MSWLNLGKLLGRCCRRGLRSLQQVLRWRFIHLSLVCLVCSLLTACQPQVTTLTIALSAPEAARWYALFEAFERAYPDIRIHLVEGPSASDAIEELYTTALSRKSPTYDLIYMDVIWVPQYAAAGWLMDLSDRISLEELAQFLPVDVAGGQYQGKLYRVPVRSNLGVLLYRQDLLEQAGLAPPRTFEELLSTAQTVQQQSNTRWGYIWQGGAYEGLSAMFVEVLAGYGGFWIDTETGKVGLDQPAALQAIQFLQQTIAQGISPERVTIYTEEETRRLFQDGEAVFMRNWPEVWAIANSTQSVVQGHVNIHPVLHGYQGMSQGCQGGWGLGIARNTPHIDAAWKAIQFFTSAEAQRQFVLESGYLPSRTALFSDPQLVRRYPHYPKMLQLLQQSVFRPAIPQYGEASAILQRYLRAALMGQLSPERAMQTAAQETRRLLNGDE